MGQLTFCQFFPSKAVLFRVVVAFWCHRHYQQVFKLCVNQHKHFDDTVLLSLAMEFQKPDGVLRAIWKSEIRETTYISWLQKVGFVRTFTGYAVQNDQSCGVTVHSSVLSFWIQWEISRKYGASIVKTSRLSVSMPWPWRTWPTTTGRINARARDASSGAAGMTVDGQCFMLRNRFGSF